MVLQKLWNQTDPKDANMLALTNKTEVLQSAFSTSSSENKASKNNEKKGSTWKPDRWKITNVGSSIKKDMKMLYWCPRHEGPQKDWHKMYIPHKTEDNDKL